MNEKMREMVDKGELSEASYKQLVDELVGRTKKEADAPLFEVLYTANMTIASAHKDPDDGVYTNQSLFNLHGGPKSIILRGVTKRRLFTVRGIHPTNQFVDFDKILIGADNEPLEDYKPGRAIWRALRMEHHA